jgi:aminocarboxymuconate-semialdehyde decarboxylase
MIAETRSQAPKPPSAYLEHFWLDTVTFDGGWLGYLIGRFGAEHVVLGSDYPLPLGPRDPVAEVRALGLAPEDERAVLGENARALLRLRAGVAA